MQQVADIVCKLNNILFTNYYTMQTVQGRSLCSRHAQFIVAIFSLGKFGRWKRFHPNVSLRFVTDHTFLEAFDFCSINFSYITSAINTRNVIPSSAVLLYFSLVRICNLSITHPYLFCEKQVFTFPKRSLGFKTVT